MIIITQENYLSKADAVMQEMVRSKTKLTTSKIRKLLAMVSDIYNQGRREKSELLGEGILGQIQYLKLHMVYEAGREKSVKDFIKKAQLIEAIDEIEGSKEQLIRFCHYMEALVAYKKFYDERDN